MHAFSGSLAMVAAPRMAFVVVEDTLDEQRRLMLPVKNNLGPMAAGLGYRIETAYAGRRIRTSMT